MVPPSSFVLQTKHHVHHQHHQNKDSRIKVLFLLSMGWLMGALSMYFLMIFSFSSGVNSIAPTSSVSLSELGLPAERRQEQHGWKTLNVFYGKEQGLKIPNDQTWFSQCKQDEIVMDLITDKNGLENNNNNNGYYFIDLASNDAKEFSNTLALERHGWQGLCIEPNPTYWYGLSHRKCTVVGALVGGETTEKVEVKFRGVYGGMVGKMDMKLANRKREPPAPTEERYTAPLRQVIQQFHVPKTVHYMSLDVEGMEIDIMQHFPFDQITIQVLTVERPTVPLRNLLEQHGYVFLKDLVWWGETLWAHNSTGLSPNHPKIAKIQTEQRN